MEDKELLKKNQNLNQYLEFEKLLNKFFRQVNYCHAYCITQKDSKIGEGVDGNLGCCYLNYYRHDETDKSSCDFDLLIKKRAQKYGLPADKEKSIGKNKNACRYHTNKGCILKDYKSPLCISFICRPFKVYLIEKYDIYYNFQEIMDVLENILSGRINKEEMKEFKERIKAYTEIIVKTKKPDF